MAAVALSLIPGLVESADTDSDATTATESPVEVGFYRPGLLSQEELWMKQLERNLRQPVKMMSPPPKEPAPLFIEEPLPPSMKVKTPFVADYLNPFLPAKKRPSFAQELGQMQQFQFTYEPAVIRTCDLSAF